MPFDTIVITGVSSFVGFHLAKTFSQDGWKVVAVTSKPKEEYDGVRKQRLDVLQGKVEWETLDFTDEKKTRSFISNVKPDVWLHHAGYAVRYASLDYDIKKGNSVNVDPLHTIFEALHKNNAAGVVITGSSIEYGNVAEGCGENDLCAPQSPYGSSKLMETETALQLAKKYNLATRITRLFIPFGPLDSESKLLSVVIRNLKKGVPVDLASGAQERDFLYIDDVVSVYQRLVDDLKKGGAEIFNICSGKPTSLKTVVELIAEQLGADRSLLRFGVYPAREGEAVVFYGLNEKARRYLQWQPRPLEEGIKEYLKCAYYS